MNNYINFTFLEQQNTYVIEFNNGYEQEKTKDNFKDEGLIVQLNTLRDQLQFQLINGIKNYQDINNFLFLYEKMKRLIEDNSMLESEKLFIFENVLFQSEDTILKLLQRERDTDIIQEIFYALTSSIYFLEDRGFVITRDFFREREGLNITSLTDVAKFIEKSIKDKQDINEIDLKGICHFLVNVERRYKIKFTDTITLEEIL